MNNEMKGKTYITEPLSIGVGMATDCKGIAIIDNIGIIKRHKAAQVFADEDSRWYICLCEYPIAPPGLSELQFDVGHIPQLILGSINAVLSRTLKCNCVLVLGIHHRGCKASKSTPFTHSSSSLITHKADEVAGIPAKNTLDCVCRIRRAGSVSSVVSAIRRLP